MTIDLFEMQVLVEACWNHKTGVRTGVLQKCIDEWYKELRVGERVRCYNFWKRTQDEPNDEYTGKVMARFNPDNQYIVSINGADAPCYKHNDRYYRDSMHWLPEDLITKIERM